MKHKPGWEEILTLFGENERRIRALSPAPAMPGAEFCRQSQHRTLGHLTACQQAWLPLMRRIKEEAPRGAVAVHPLRLYDQLGYATAGWALLMERFCKDRAEWGDLLRAVDLDRPLKTPTRLHTARTLTEKLVRHESRHMDELGLDR
ncbi:MAG: DinB family protein [Armatimonadetes bacterium]|nr:DinB family protein [Armatimonadota bacterium]